MLPCPPSAAPSGASQRLGEGTCVNWAVVGMFLGSVLSCCFWLVGCVSPFSPFP